MAKVKSSDNTTYPHTTGGSVEQYSLSEIWVLSELKIACDQ